MELDKIIKELRRPFPAEYVDFKIQAVGTKAALCVAYVDARLVQERLNDVCEGYWSHSFSDLIIAEGKVQGVTCRINIHSIETGEVIVSHEDIGALDNVNERLHGLKALYSDAFKRAAVHFGVAVSLYDLPNLFLSKNKSEGFIKFDSNDKPVGVTNDGSAKLRELYEKTLDNHLIHKFGDPRA